MDYYAELPLLFCRYTDYDRHCHSPSYAPLSGPQKRSDRRKRGGKEVVFYISATAVRPLRRTERRRVCLSFTGGLLCGI